VNEDELDILLTPEAGRLLDELGPLGSADAATAAVARLRKAGHPADLVAAVVSQARLRARARAKLGDAALGMLFSDPGLQQATRSEVAALHAARFAAAGVQTVADLGCGIGADSLAFLRAGLRVRAVEREPVTAQIAAFNLARASGTSGCTHSTSGGTSRVEAAMNGRGELEWEVRIGDAETADLADEDGAWLDPARRDGSRRLSDPADWSPSLDFAFGLGDRHPTGVKLGPGMERSLIPETAEAQWVSVHGEVVELVVWCGVLARPGIRRAALMLARGDAHELTAGADSPDVEPGPLGAFLLEPDGAVIRARLIGDLARSLPGSARMLDPTIAWITTDAPPATPFGQAFRVTDELPVDEKALRRALAARDIGALEIKVRGLDVDPDAFRRRVLPKSRALHERGGTNAATLVLTRIGGRRRAILAERL